MKAAGHGRQSYVDWGALPARLEMEGIKSRALQRTLTYVAAGLAEGPVGLQAAQARFLGPAQNGPLSIPSGQPQAAGKPHHEHDAAEDVNRFAEGFHRSEEILAALPLEATHGLAHQMHGMVEAVSGHPELSGPLGVVAAAALAKRAGAGQNVVAGAATARQVIGGRNARGGALFTRQAQSDVAATQAAIRSDPLCAGADLKPADIAVAENSFRDFDPDSPADVANLATMFAGHDTRLAQFADAEGQMAKAFSPGMAPASSALAGSPGQNRTTAPHMGAAARPFGHGPRLGEGPRLGQNGIG